MKSFVIYNDYKYGVYELFITLIFLNSYTKKQPNYHIFKQ